MTDVRLLIAVTAIKAKCKEYGYKYVFVGRYNEYAFNPEEVTLPFRLTHEPLYGRINLRNVWHVVASPRIRKFPSHEDRKNQSNEIIPLRDKLPRVIDKICIKYMRCLKHDEAWFIDPS